MGGSHSRILHRSLRADLPTATHGSGPYLFDQAGRRYLDASGGAAVSCLGHSHLAVIEAVVNQIKSLPFAHTSFFTSEPAERLADFLMARAPRGLSRAAFVSGGSEAVETAIKLSRQYWLERGQPSRAWIVSRRLSFHGNTLGALSVGGHLARRERYLPYLLDKVEFISPCYAYRDRREGEPDEAYGLRAANELEAAIDRLQPDNVAAFIAEPIGGATAGCLMPAPGYFTRIREICDRTGVLFIADEIMCGMGRTGTLFACEQEGVAPDLVAIAKGLAAGYQPLGGVLVSDAIVRAIENGSGMLGTGHTYMGHAVACAAALAVQLAIEEEHLLDNVRRMGALLERRLRDRFGSHPHVGDIRGRGLFWALELVEDRATKKPFDPGLELYRRVKREALRQGLICYPSGGAFDGTCGDHILLAPPYIIDESHIEELVRLLSIGLDAALASLQQPAAARAGRKRPG
ncbi:MAG: aspartate aminotransferase family protein [Acidobacteria bacterium]|nr:aspartate aminotransferase family protein [Acidobacteriota bacterium]